MLVQNIQIMSYLNINWLDNLPSINITCQILNSFEQFSHLIDNLFNTHKDLKVQFFFLKTYLFFFPLTMYINKTLCKTLLPLPVYYHLSPS